MQMGDNVEVTVKGDTLTITVDLSKRLGPSATGKTIGIATTRGNQPISPSFAHSSGAVIGLNVYTKRTV